MAELDPVRWSNLKNMALSPLHYRARLLAGRDTSSMKLGRVVHHLLLGGGEIVVFDGERRAGKIWDAFAAEHADKEIVKASELAEAERIAAAVRDNAEALSLLFGSKERLIDWEFCGRKMRSHLDVLGARWVTDLKTTRSAKPEWFRWQAIKMAYHAQLAAYVDAARYVGAPVEEAYLVAVETEEPYAVTAMRLTERALEDGRKLNRLWMERLLSCEATGEWPGYVQSIVDLDTAEREPVGLVMPDGEEVAA